MGIVAEMRAAMGIVDALPEGRRDDLWAFLKAPDGSPFFRFGVEPPGSASLLPTRRRWRFVASLPGRRDYLEDIAPIATDGHTIVSGVARAFWRLGLEVRDAAGDPNIGLLLQAFFMARSSDDALAVAGTGETLGDYAARSDDYKDALKLLFAAHEAATRMQDGNAIARLQPKLAWVRARVSG